MARRMVFFSVLIAAVVSVPSSAFAADQRDASAAGAPGEVALSSTTGSGCTVGALADQVDARPSNVYGGGWVNCSARRVGIHITVHLYRDGTLVAAGQNSCGIGYTCWASTPEYTDWTPGLQAWTAVAIVLTELCPCYGDSNVLWH